MVYIDGNNVDIVHLYLKWKHTTGALPQKSGECPKSLTYERVMRQSLQQEKYSQKNKG